MLTANFSAASVIQGNGVVTNQIAIDAQGNSYVTGSYFGKANFGSGTTRDNTGPTEAFVVKYSPSGAVNWFTQFQPQAGSSSDGSSLVVDSANQTATYWLATSAGRLTSILTGPAARRR